MLSKVGEIVDHLSLMYLKGALRFLAGAKTRSGQIPLKKEVVRSKLNFKFSSHPAKHKILIWSFGTLR